MGIRRIAGGDRGCGADDEFYLSELWGDDECGGAGDEYPVPVLRVGACDCGAG